MGVPYKWSHAPRQDGMKRSLFGCMNTQSSTYSNLQKGSVMETQSNRLLNSGRHIGVFIYEAYLADEIGGECLDPDKEGDIVYRDGLDNPVLSTVQVVVPRDYPKENAIRHIRKIADWIERDGIPAELPPGEEENRYRPA
jgi:hypothetical protein